MSDRATAGRAARTYTRTASISLLLLVALLAFPSAPRAGTYTVYACDAAGGANNSWAPSANHPNMAAYVACPSSGNYQAGLVARNVVKPTQSSERVPYGAQAAQRFDAPAGAAITGITASFRLVVLGEGWNVGLSTGAQYLHACYGGGGGVCYDYQDAPIYIPVPSTSLIYWEAFCWSWSGCRINGTTVEGEAARANARVYYAAVHIDDGSLPGVSLTGGGLMSDGWLRGDQDIAFDAGDNVGIRATRLYVDGTLRGDNDRPCDFTRPAPCPNGGGTYSIDTRGLPDGPHSVDVAAIDTAGNANTASRTFSVDNTAPGRPSDIAVEGGDGWRATNDFAVRWRSPAQEHAPIVKAHYSLCPLGGQRPCREGSREGAGFEGITGLRVPEPGDYVVRVWLEDEAGNADRENASDAVRLRFDNEPPQLAFEAQDPGDPLRIAVAASDPGSGLARGEVETRRQGTTAWRPLATALEPQRLVAYVDDSQLRAGTYEFRVRAVDRAGNERSTDKRVDGGKMELSLPVRMATRLRAGVVRTVPKLVNRGGRKVRRPVARLKTRAHVRFGRRARIRGRLTAADRSPLAGASLTVFAQPRTTGARFAPVGEVATDEAGWFTYLAAPGVSRILRFEYPGTRLIRSLVRHVWLRVPASTTIGVSRRFALNGESVVFSGRLRARPPAAGKLIEVQAFFRGRWRTFATPRANARGRWRLRYRFQATRGRVTYRFRALVPREPSYPFERGVSRSIGVRVQGL